MHVQARVALGVLWLVGCATPTVGPDRPWIEVSSSRFRVLTDGPEADARKLIEDLELFRAAVGLLTNLGDAEERVPTRILAFEKYTTFQRFADRHVAGYFVPTMRQNLVALPLGGVGKMDSRAILFHEYTHFLVHNRDSLTYPLWFSEGFAELLSSVQVRADRLIIGMPPSHRMDAFRYLGGMSFGRLLRTGDLSKWPDRSMAMFYAQSWLLVHYLMYGRPPEEGDFGPRMTRYLDLTGEGVDEARAFEQAFGMDLGVLENRVVRYSGRQVPAFGLPVAQLAPDSDPPGLRAIGLDEMSQQLGWLALITGRADQARDLFGAALAARPDNARALAGLGDLHRFAGEWEQALPYYQRALEADPDDFENHLEYAEYLDALSEEQPERRAALLAEARRHLRRAIELAPASPEAHAILGATYGREGEDPRQGVAHLERAQALLPSNAAIRLRLGRIYAAVGRRAEAEHNLTRVLVWAHDATTREAAAEALESLQERPTPDPSGG